MLGSLRRPGGNKVETAQPAHQHIWSLDDAVCKKESNQENNTRKVADKTCKMWKKEMRDLRYDSKLKSGVNYMGRKEAEETCSRIKR